MNEDDYTLEYLIETFQKHHLQVIDDRKELERKIESGEVMFEEWMREPFSISLALNIICKEIKELKENK